jgi:putative methionine-R-sulfoxide reductase with GAF domain
MLGDVTTDPHYLTAFGSTRSEMIVPFFDETGKRVAGTFDIESEAPKAFSPDEQALMERCASAVQVLVSRLSAP